jgi:hypothetical protein
METDGHGRRLGYQATKARRESYEDLHAAAAGDAKGEPPLAHRQYTRWRYSDRPRSTPADLIASEHQRGSGKCDGVSPVASADETGDTRGKVSQALGVATVVALLPEFHPDPGHFARVLDEPLAVAA